MGTHAEPAMPVAEDGTTWRLRLTSTMAYTSLVLAVLATLSIPAILAFFAIIRTLTITHAVYLMFPFPDISYDSFIVPITGALGLGAILSGGLALGASVGIQPRPGRSINFAGIAVALAVIDLCVVLIMVVVGWEMSLRSLPNG